MPTYTLKTETTIDAPLDEVFDFFSKAENLERITPPELSFKILTPLPIVMKAGALIDYKIKLGIFPMNWRTEITVWEPGVRFVDSQLKGPYKKWIHEHRFEARGDKTYMSDQIDYEVPGGPLAPIIHALFIKKKVAGIFDHRQTVIEEIFRS
jgi:ligand-binding SRPBCC domain-containing protein